MIIRSSVYCTTESLRPEPVWPEIISCLLWVDVGYDAVLKAGDSVLAFFAAYPNAGTFCVHFFSILLFPSIISVA